MTDFLTACVHLWLPLSAAGAAGLAAILSENHLRNNRNQ